MITWRELFDYMHGLDEDVLDDKIEAFDPRTNSSYRVNILEHEGNSEFHNDGDPFLQLVDENGEPLEPLEMVIPFPYVENFGDELQKVA